MSLWFLPITAMLALSAVYLNWGDYFRAATGAIMPVSQTYDQAAAPVEPDFAPPVGVQQAVASAASQAPGQLVDGVSLMPEKGLYRVRLFDDRDIDPGTGRRYIYVDNRTGQIRADEHVAAAASGDVFLAWQFPLHSGKVFGWPGRIAVFIAGILISLAVVTGYLIYFHKRRARASAPARMPRQTYQAMPAE